MYMHSPCEHSAVAHKGKKLDSPRWMERNTRDTHSTPPLFGCEQFLHFEKKKKYVKLTTFM